MADFDGNGTGEKIITRTIGGKDVPVFLKKEVTDQIARLQKQNLKYYRLCQKIYSGFVSGRSDEKYLGKNVYTIQFVHCIQ